jgi:hypothetical protein
MSIDIPEEQYVALKNAVLDRQKKGQHISAVELIREALEKELGKKEGARK